VRAEGQNAPSRRCFPCTGSRSATGGGSLCCARVRECTSTASYPAAFCLVCGPYDPVVYRLRRSILCAAVGLLVVVLGDGGRWGRAPPTTVPAASSAQALRTCVDRWNQDNMVGWGSMSVRIAVRALDVRERGRVSFGNDAQRRCTLSLAGRPGDNSSICRIDEAGGYDCPLITSDGMPPLRNANGRTDRRGVLKLSVALKGDARAAAAFLAALSARRRLCRAVVACGTAPSRSTVRLEGSWLVRPRV